jgi:hypothetical protein
MTSTETKSKFASTINKGFQMTFENGWSISVQFGYGNYCDNGHHPDGIHFSTNVDVVTSTDAEIGIWDKNGDWYNFGADGVKGYCSTDEVAEWIWKVKNF